MAEHHLTVGDIAQVTACVHQPAIDVLGPVVDPRTIHQSKFSMGFVLALVAVRGRAGLADFTESALTDPALRAFHNKVTMVLDPEIDGAYPARWMGARSSRPRTAVPWRRRYRRRLAIPRTRSRALSLLDKAARLAAYGGDVTPEEMARITERVWRLHDEPDVAGGCRPAEDADDV